jgi:hypothetical protein
LAEINKVQAPDAKAVMPAHHCFVTQRKLERYVTFCGIETSDQLRPPSTDLSKPLNSFALKYE